MAVRPRATVVLGLILVLASGGLAAAADEGEDLQKVTVQYAFFNNNGQLGDVVALEKGFYAEEGLDVELVQGGPALDAVAVVASGGADIGQASSSPALMLAISQGIPIQVFATGAQEHPFAFVGNPGLDLDEASDLAGMRVGVTPTAVVLVDALAASAGVPRDEIEVVPVTASDLTPVLTNQVDVMGTWLTSHGQLSAIPDYSSLRLWDAGLQLYALPYYAPDSVIQDDPELLNRFLRATARGWLYAKDNLEESIDILVKHYPDLDRDGELAGAQSLLDFIFTDATDAGGWGTMDPEVWQRQIDTWDRLDQFQGSTPTVDDVVYFGALEATTEARLGE